MKYQTQTQIHCNADSSERKASHTISWVRTSFIIVLSASMMAVALYQMATYIGILAEHSHSNSMSSSSGSTATARSGKIFDTDERLRGKYRLRVKKETHFHLHVHNSSEGTNTGASDTGASHSTVSSATATATAIEEEPLDEIETYLDEVTVDEVELEHEEYGDVHENKVKDEVVVKEEDEVEVVVKEEVEVVVKEEDEVVVVVEEENEVEVEVENDGEVEVEVKEEVEVEVEVDDEHAVELDEAETTQDNNFINEELTSSHLEGKSASAPKSVAEHELAHLLELVTESEREPQPVPEPVHQDQQLHNHIIANFINEYHESIHVNWIHPKTGEEKRVLKNIAPGASKSLETDPKKTFVAFNDARTFRQLFTVDVSNQANKTETFFHIANGEKVEKEGEEVHRDNEHENENENEQEAPPKVLTLAKFVNNFSQNVNINWINPQTGNEKTVITNLKPNSDKSLETHNGHEFVAYNEDRTLRQVFVMNVKDGFTEIHKIMGSSRSAEL